jgi:hypothetical protein
LEDKCYCFGEINTVHTLFACTMRITYTQHIIECLSLCFTSVEKQKKGNSKTHYQIDSMIFPVSALIYTYQGQISGFVEPGIYVMS